MIDLSKTQSSIDVKTVQKTYEVKFLRGSRLNVMVCEENVLPDLLSQIIKDGHTLTKITLN